jgi:hypothetical protein
MAGPYRCYPYRLDRKILLEECLSWQRLVMPKWWAGRRPEEENREEASLVATDELSFHQN